MHHPIECLGQALVGVLEQEVTDQRKVLHQVAIAIDDRVIDAITDRVNFVGRRIGHAGDLMARSRRFGRALAQPTTLSLLSFADS